MAHGKNNARYSALEEEMMNFSGGVSKAARDKALEEEMQRVASRIIKQIRDEAVNIFAELREMSDDKRYGRTCKKLIREMMVKASDIATGTIAPDTADLEDIIKAKYYVKMNSAMIDAKGYAEETREIERKKEKRERRAEHIEEMMENLVAIGYEQIQAIYQLENAIFSVEDAVRDSIDVQRQSTAMLTSSFSENIEKLAGVQLSIAMEQDRRQRELSEGSKDYSDDLHGIRNDLDSMNRSSKRLDNARYRKGEYSIFD